VLAHSRLWLIELEVRANASHWMESGSLAPLAHCGTVTGQGYVQLGGVIVIRIGCAGQSCMRTGVGALAN
jgi:hypothetical protein